jgi:cytochrome c-type biogenesis protein CcmH
MRGTVRALTTAGLLGFATLAGPAAAAPDHGEVAPDSSFSEYVPGAATLEGRLLAPCCWDSSRQTLDIHGSPIANELRREIRSRLKAGESVDAVEADLVRRYTTKILAVPTESRVPRMGMFLIVAMVGAGIFAGTRVAKWRKREVPPVPPVPSEGGPAKPAAKDEWDAQIDSALEDRD